MNDDVTKEELIELLGEAIRVADEFRLLAEKQKLLINRVMLTNDDLLHALKKIAGDMTGKKVQWLA